MKNHNKPLSKGDLQFLYNQRSRIIIDIFISMGIIYILANVFMFFTNNFLLMGFLPIAIGVGYGIWSIRKKIKETREYWKNN